MKRFNTNINSIILLLIAVLFISSLGSLDFGALRLTNTSTAWNANTLTHNPITGNVNTIKVPHVFLCNDSSNVTQSLTNTWTDFAPSIRPYFEFVGMANVDSLNNDTIGLLYTGHYWFKGGLSVSGINNIWIKTRLYNVTKAKEIKGRHSQTLSSDGNHTTIPIDGYCTFCEARDKIVLQLLAEQNVTITVYDGSISFWGNHGY